MHNQIGTTGQRKMKHRYTAISAALAGTVLFVSATIVQASLGQPQVARPAGSNIASKADRVQLPAPMKGDLLPIQGTFAPMNQVMLYQTSPTTSTALALPSIALVY